LQLDDVCHHHHLIDLTRPSRNYSYASAITATLLIDAIMVTLSSSIDVFIDSHRSFEHFYYEYATAITGTFANAIFASSISLSRFDSHDCFFVTQSFV
jgi:hypothetical protein